MQISNPHPSPPGQTVAAMVAVTRAAGTVPNAASRDLSMVEPGASGWSVDGVAVTISDEARAAADAAISEVATRRGITFDDRMTALVYRDFAGREAGAAPTAPPGAPVWGSLGSAPAPDYGEAPSVYEGPSPTGADWESARVLQDVSTNDEDAIAAMEEHAHPRAAQAGRMGGAGWDIEGGGSLSPIGDGYADEQTDLMIGGAPEFLEDGDHFSLDSFDTSEEGPGWYQDDDENTATQVEVVEF